MVNDYSQEKILILKKPFFHFISKSKGSINNFVSLALTIIDVEIEKALEFRKPNKSISINQYRYSKTLYLQLFDKNIVAST